MGFMDKVKEKASKAAGAAKQSVSESSAKMKEWNEERKEMDVKDTTIRISVGLEDVDDIYEDIY